MLPLIFADSGKEYIIKKIGGSTSVKNHLKTLGFAVGGKAKVVTINSGNLIVAVKESRVAINRETAQKIMV